MLAGSDVKVKLLQDQAMERWMVEPGCHRVPTAPSNSDIEEDGEYERECISNSNGKRKRGVRSQGSKSTLNATGSGLISSSNRDAGDGDRDHERECMTRNSNEKQQHRGRKSRSKPTDTGTISSSDCDAVDEEHEHECMTRNSNYSMKRGRGRPALINQFDWELSDEQLVRKQAQIIQAKKYKDTTTRYTDSLQIDVDNKTKEIWYNSKIISMLEMQLKERDNITFKMATKVLNEADNYHAAQQASHRSRRSEEARTEIHDRELQDMNIVLGQYQPNYAHI